MSVQDEALTVRITAERELATESFRERVEKAKVRIRAQRARARWWHKLIPFTITIRRREP